MGFVDTITGAFSHDQPQTHDPKGGDYYFTGTNPETGETEVFDLYNELFELDDPDEWNLVRHSV